MDGSRRGPVEQPAKVRRGGRADRLIEEQIHQVEREGVQAGVFQSEACEAGGFFAVDHDVYAGDGVVRAGFFHLGHPAGATEEWGKENIAPDFLGEAGASIPGPVDPALDLFRGELGRHGKAAGAEINLADLRSLRCVDAPEDDGGAVHFTEREMIDKCAHTEAGEPHGALKAKAVPRPVRDIVT